ncbi:MAG: MarR family transcriptional regulator [Acidimicrobiales bacterium]|jgi:DNA-binding MarR family transcriptional regulator
MSSLTLSPEVASADRLRLTLVRLVRTLRRRGRSRLTPSQVSALSTVEEYGPMRISALATYESLGASAATRVVASLEELELLERMVDPDDKRASLVNLSERGRSEFDELKRERTLDISSMLEKLSAKERQTIEAALPALEKIARDN